MVICPVCRSQNMDTAKFCGNCGNSFNSESESTGSLINCSQGHIYSAVYQYCPYCPQPSGEEKSAFATRVEDISAALENQHVQTMIDKPPENDFSTNIDTGETVFETMEQQVVDTESTKKEGLAQPETEVIGANQFFDDFSTPSESAQPTRIETQSPTTVEESVNHKDLKDSTLDVEGKPAAPPAPPPIDRHTVLATDSDAQIRSTKGKIVGWLISYSINPDGEDFRIYEGYNRLGANPVCDIIINDDTVSGSHAIIVYRDGKCMIKDDLSRNGTFVNGREITEAHPLQNYDQVRVGSTNLSFISAVKPG